MYKHFISLALVLTSVFSFANAIDDKCPTLTYKTAPIVVADQFVCHKQYALAYNFETKTAKYTTAYIEKSMIGDVNRSNNFRRDPKLVKKYAATKSDYLNSICNEGQCDKGHLQPSEDFSATSEGVSESFYMSNMVPQHYKNNQVIWKYLEIKVRMYVKHKNPVYVITGPVYTKKPYATIGRDVAVPDSLFKVIVDANTGASIAFMMENTHFPVGSLNGKVVSIQAIEEATGIIFDRSLEKTKSSSYQEWFSSLK